MPTLHEKGTDADTDTHTRRDTQKGKGAKMDPHSENNLSDGEIKYKHKVRKKNLKENKFISKMVEIRRGLKAGTTVDAKDAKTKRNDKDTDNSTKKEKATWSADDADEEADAIAAKERKKMKRGTWYGVRV